MAKAKNKKNRKRTAQKIYQPVKRAQDIIMSAMMLVVFSPLMLLTSVMIWLDDPHGSPVFAQARCGKGGKEFRMYKLRSMHVDAEQRLAGLMAQNEMDGPAFKMHDDPRITRVGKIIRKTGVDELPQLINVLKGDMSLVGPRPALPREVARYDAYQKQRLSVKPGITCYWQVQPKRNSISFDEWMELDMRYIREQGFFTDWKIMLRTVGAMLNGEGE